MYDFFSNGGVQDKRIRVNHDQGDLAHSLLLPSFGNAGRHLRLWYSKRRYHYMDLLLSSIGIAD